ncbi:hypothetical protein [uncultured Brevundimonas sp.]|uniref:hypothetical protein n=1 Tax=uncultured Brevundimonas sp. TaxID=213418 RepID=UPI0030EBA4EC|tara:strand:- start:521 stop:736 length:216 start_codon:yes stop_codon:yes gene_type:complete
MIRLSVLLIALMTSACVPPAYEADPVSAQQWQERQDRIARRAAEQARLCAITKPEDPRYDQLCNSTPRDRP